MSKIKKKPIDRATTTVSKKDINFEKAIQFAGWFFMIAFLAFTIYWLTFDLLLKQVDVIMGSMLYAYFIFTGTSTALCFALATKIKKNRDKKRSIFIDWLIAEFLFSMFAIFLVAIYIW